MNPKVLILILNYNKKDYLVTCIESVIRLEYDAFNLLVVDNHSTDGSVIKIKEKFPALWIIETDYNMGAVGGRNFGLNNVDNIEQYKYILFLDDDSEVTPKSLSIIIQCLEKDPQAGIACGKTYTGFPPKTIMSCGMRTQFFFARCYDIRGGLEDIYKEEEENYVDACGAFALVIRRDLLQTLNYFDTVFSPYGWEDVDLCLRAKQKGYRVKYVSRAIFSHKGTRLGRMPKAEYESSKIKNFLQVIVRHATFYEKIGCLFFVPLRGFYLMIGFLIKGQWRMIPAMIEGVLRAMGFKESVK